MSTCILIFGDIKIKERRFYNSERPTNITNVDVDKVVISDR